MVPSAAKYIREHAPEGEPAFGAADTLRLGKKQVAERASVMQMIDLVQQLAAMDAMGVDIQLLTTPGQ